MVCIKVYSLVSDMNKVVIVTITKGNEILRHDQIYLSCIHSHKGVPLIKMDPLSLGAAPQHTLISAAISPDITALHIFVYSLYILLGL